MPTLPPRAADCQNASKTMGFSPIIYQCIFSPLFFFFFNQRATTHLYQEVPVLSFSLLWSPFVSFKIYLKSSCTLFHCRCCFWLYIVEFFLADTLWIGWLFFIVSVKLWKKKQFLYLRILTFISIINFSDEIAVFQTAISFAEELKRNLF